MAEKLAFDEVGRQRGTVDLDERVGRPLAVVVDRVRNQFLAGAALPANEDGALLRLTWETIW